MLNVKRIFGLLILCFMLLPNFILAAEQPIALVEYHHDVTGDGKKETIILYGEKEIQDSPYFNKIWAEVSSNEFPSPIKIEYEGGYEPKIEFADLTHDGVDDLLFSAATGGSGGVIHYALHTLKGGELKEIPLPSSAQIQGVFQDHFKAIITIPGIKEPIQLDLTDRKQDYLRLGLYQKDGKLNEPTELMISPIVMFEIVPIEGKKGVGLKGYQQISGAYHADGLGTVMTTWYYENGSWSQSDVQWEEAK